VAPPGLAVTVYPVMAMPPLLAGAVNATSTSVELTRTAVPIVGAPGTTGLTVNVRVTCGAAR